MVSWYNEAEDGKITEPFGPGPVGFISYSPDGHIFAHLARADRSAHVRNDMTAGTDAENSASMRSHVSYAGRYRIEGDHVIHDVVLSAFPNWTGTAQRRAIHFEGDALRLSSAPFAYDGTMIVAHAVWRRPGHA